MLRQRIIKLEFNLIIKAIIQIVLILTRPASKILIIYLSKSEEHKRI